MENSINITITQNVINEETGTKIIARLEDFFTPFYISNADFYIISIIFYYIKQ